MPAKKPAKKIDAPSDLFYDRNHMWVRKEGDTLIVGWTRHAVENAGDVSYLVLPKQGEILVEGGDFGSIETGKWVGRFSSPVSGEVVAVNTEAVKDPGVLNEDPFGKGWLLKVKAKGAPKGLLDAKAYIKFVNSLEK
jgi:glycine cleavage system H protein